MSGAKTLTALPEWTALKTHYESVKDLQLRGLFASDASRGERLTVEAAGLMLDYSKNRVTDETIGLLLALAKARGVTALRDRMFAGEKINISEQRAVGHVALRAPQGERVSMDGKDVVPEVHAVLDRMAAFSDEVRTGARTGHTGKRIRNVINIGIGGSYLGPEMAYRALRRFRDPGITVKFVSNVDGAAFEDATHGLSIRTRRCLSSPQPTFRTTLETMTNAAASRRWVLKAIGSEKVRHRPPLRRFIDQTQKGSANSASTPPICSDFGTGLGAAIRWITPTDSRR